MPHSFEVIQNPHTLIMAASTLLLLAIAFLPVSFATMLYNGLQTSIITSNMSAACDAAFNTSINCPENDIQFLTYSLQSVGKFTSSLYRKRKFVT